MLLTAPYTPQIGSPMVLPLLVITSHTSMNLLMGGGGSPTAVSLLHPRHAESDNTLIATLLSGQHHSQDIATLASVYPGIWVPHQSSDTFKMLPTGSPTHHKGWRAYKPSSWKFSEAPPYQTTRSGCQTFAATRPGFLLQPGHHIQRKSPRSLEPPFYTRPTLPRLLLTTKSSDASLHLQPY